MGNPTAWPDNRPSWEDNHSSWSEDLEKHFGYGDNSEEKWQTLQHTLLPGDTVTGHIVACAPFGVWLDIGVGYPALLEIGCIREPDFAYPLYWKGTWGNIGTELAARVAGLRADTGHKQIYLCQ